MIELYGWDKKCGPFGRTFSLVIGFCSVMFALLRLVDIFNKGFFDFNSSDKLFIPNLIWGCAFLIIAARGKLF